MKAYRKSERTKFHDALQNTALKGRRIFNNVVHDPEHHRGVLDVAAAVLDGEIEYRKKNFQKAFEHLHLAVKRDMALVYS